MIMDEVLAVGDMAFQKKCLDKMNDVSHNMNITRRLSGLFQKSR